MPFISGFLCKLRLFRLQVRGASQRLPGKTMRFFGFFNGRLRNTRKRVQTIVLSPQIFKEAMTSGSQRKIKDQTEKL